MGQLIFKSLNEDGSKIVFKSEAVFLSDVLSDFRLFLLGAGYHVEGDIVVEEQFEEPVSSNEDLTEQFELDLSDTEEDDVSEAVDNI
jgi:hypothetical protein